MFRIHNTVKCDQSCMRSPSVSQKCKYCNEEPSQSVVTRRAFADRLIYPPILYLFTLLLLFTIRVFMMATEKVLYQSDNDIMAVSLPLVFEILLLHAFSSLIVQNCHLYLRSSQSHTRDQGF